jgi:3-dehydroquinate synthetase
MARGEKALPAVRGGVVGWLAGWLAACRGVDEVTAG